MDAIAQPDEVRILESKMQDVVNGSDVSYVKRINEIVSVRDQNILKAKEKFQYQLREMNQLLCYELKKIEDIFENSKRKVQQKMLDDLQERKQKLLSSNRGSKRDVKTHTLRRLRPKNNLTNNTSFSEMRRESSAQTDQTTQTIPSLLLPAGTIKEDMQAIHNNWVESVKSTSVGNCTAARVEHGVIFCNEHIYEVGCNVLLHTDITRESHSASITSISKKEIYFRLNDGMKVRIPINHLRNGRATVQKFT